MGQDAEVCQWVKRREVSFESNHAPAGIVSVIRLKLGNGLTASDRKDLCVQLLGDLTGRGEQYLVVGGLDGSLAVFKVSHRQI